MFNSDPSSTPAKRKDGKAVSADETAEWKGDLDECLKEVKELEVPVKY